ncbi:hypothetical protein GCM10010415_10520 [Streptomyces atrovirens]
MSPRRAVQVEPSFTASVAKVPVPHFFGLGAAAGAEEAVAAGVLAGAEGAALDPADAEALTEGEAEGRCRFGPRSCWESSFSSAWCRASERCCGERSCAAVTPPTTAKDETVMTVLLFGDRRARWLMLFDSFVAGGT